MEQSILPVLGSQGTYELLPPFDTKITPEEIYTCKAIRSISEYISYNQDAKKEVYDYYGLSDEDFEEDVKNDIQIISLQNDDGVWLYVPSRFISKYPDANGIPYKQIAIVTKLPALKSDRDLSFLITDIDNLVKDSLGVSSNVSIVELSRTISVVKELSIQMEAERSLLTSGKSTDRSRYISLKNELESLLERIKKLEEYIKTINGVFRLDGPNKVIKGSTIPYKIIGYNEHMVYNVSVSAGTVVHSTRYINFTAPNEITTVTITINDIDFLISVLEDLPNIVTPEIHIINTDPYTGPDVGFITSQYLTTYITDIHISTDWQIATDSNFENIISSVERSSVYKTHFVITDLYHDTTYYVRARFYGSDIHVSDWGSTSFTTREKYIEKPSITQPYTGTNNLGPDITFVSDEFSIISGTDIHRASIWQVATDLNFLNIVSDTVESGINLTSYTINSLIANTQYYIRVKYFGYTKGDSEWSDIISIRTLNTYLVTPTISKPINNEVNLGPSIDFTSSDFLSLTFSDEHISTDWQIATDTNFINKVSEKLASTENKLQYRVDRLNPNSSYYIRVRYNSKINGTSAWSPVIKFYTKYSYIKIPYIINPINNTENLGPIVNITSSIFESLDIDNHASSDWQVSKDENFSIIAYDSINSSTNLISFVIKNIDPSSKYYIRVRYKGENGDYSDWSDIVYFYTHSSYIKTPIILKPEHGDLNIGPILAVESSPYTTVDYSSHESSDWQVSTTTDFTNIISNLIDSTVSKTKFISINLLANTNYYIRTRYKSQYGFYSAWSDGYLFTTASSYVETPNIISPVHGVIDQGPSVAFTSTPYVSIDNGDHKSSDWQIASTVDFVTLALNLIDNEKYKTIVNVNNLVQNTIYYARVRYKSTNDNYSNWSNAIQFTTFFLY